MHTDYFLNFFLVPNLQYFFRNTVLITTLRSLQGMYRVIAFSLFMFMGQLVMAQDQLSQNKVERLYRNGTELINHSNYGAARMVFSEFLQLAPPTDSRRGEAEYYVAFSAH